MKIRKALYAGSFDPFTVGHLDIVNRALHLFDEITLVIAVSPSKKPFLSREERESVLNEYFADEDRVKIACWDGLIIDYAKENDITSIVRGLRPTGDFENEFQMASVNRRLSPELETVFFMTGENLYYISSSIVKEVFSHGGDISQFVPVEILKVLEAKR